MTAEPPDSPPFEKEPPLKVCPECGDPEMEYDPKRNGWSCKRIYGIGNEAEGCPGSIDDVDAEPSFDEICLEDR